MVILTHFFQLETRTILNSIKIRVRSDPGK